MAPRSGSIVVAVCLLGGGLSVAQPAPAPGPARPSGDRTDAKALMQSGVRLLEAKDYLGALAVFKDAYARFPTAKILLNIGTTLNLLDRKADAANAYQRYLDSKDADPHKVPEVANVLADLDKGVGVLEISVTPTDAEIQINDGDWGTGATAKLYRVPMGAFTVRARKDKFQAEAKSAHINIGEKAAVAITLSALPEDKIIAAPIGGGGAAGAGGNTGIGIGATAEVTGPRSKLGAFALIHLDIPRAGGAALIGITADVVSTLELQAAAIIGPTYGGYVGASFAFVPGDLRPFAAVGMPIFISNGARIGARAAGGVEFEVNRHVSLLAELGVEVLLNPENDIRKTVFIPAIGATGRL